MGQYKISGMLSRVKVYSLLSVLIVGCSSVDKPLDKTSDSLTQKTGETLTAISSQTDRSPHLEPPSLPTALKRSEAALRSKQVTHISYRLEFVLNEKLPEFEGLTSIRFDLKPKSSSLKKPILLDLEEGSIHSISINGTPLTEIQSPERFDGHHIYIRLNELKSTGNEIQISYSHPYSADGNGLHHFIDPIDQKTYLYSHFEPYSAHRVFPCFDQPDLKATYELKVEAPSDWEVISNTLEKETRIKDLRKTWTFPSSQIFSTYLFALHAGPYSVWKSQSDTIPLRLFARKSMAHYVDSAEWFKVTQQGLDFYGSLFAFPYPFKKYDQIIVPDFNAGAMENVAAVTFSERMIYRTKVTLDQHRRRADTILHEMAHMWFGDLVTLRWWNGLWLNESFATFMSSWAIDQATEFSNHWQSFFSGIKQWAYQEDQLVTTHPIEVPILDTEAAQAGFDGITYGKGASALKQLSFYLGEEEFKDGLQRYFQKFAFKNATLGDFFKQLSEASDTHLGKWEKEWMQTSGLNRIEANWTCAVDPETEENVVTQFQLHQFDLTEKSHTGPALYRTHKTRVAFFYLGKPGKHTSTNLKQEESLDVTYSSPKTDIPKAIGKPCPDFVYPNDQDFDYARVSFSPPNLHFIRKHLAQIDNPLTRQMIWLNLWEMTLDGDLSPQDYAEIVFAQANEEKSTLLLSQLLHNLASASASQNSVLKLIHPKLQEDYQKELVAYTKSHLLKAPGGSDHQLIWLRAFLESSSPFEEPFILGLLNKKQKLNGLLIDQDKRWELISALARHGTEGIQNLIQIELKKDPTDRGEKIALAAQASIPDAAPKALWLKEFYNPRADLPLAKLREAMMAYPVLGQEKWIQESANAYFENLPKIARDPDIKKEEYSKWIAKSLYPALCSPEIVQKTQSLISSSPPLPPSILKILKMNKQDEERCIRTRKKSGEAHGV